MHQRPQYRRRDSGTSSECSGRSYHSRSTAPTDYSAGPITKHHDLDFAYCQRDEGWEHESYDDVSDLRRSTETYASTIPSDAEVEDEYPVFEEPLDPLYEISTPSAHPSTPSEFASHFPSTRRLHLHHDDTIDGNMNLRVDTDYHHSSGQRGNLTLYHLRMHDLKNRDFSLRRYCRESGREVCHSSRKYTAPSLDQRPGFQRSVSNAIATLKSLSDNKGVTKTSLKRTDSGYDSMSDDDFDADIEPKTTKPPSSNPRSLPTNTTNLEFSNYAHVDLKRRGAKTSKRYEFEYWGHRYVWRRLAKMNGPLRQTSYHLYSSERVEPVAHVVPTSLTPAEAKDEEEKGGWIPPSSMWISDTGVIGGRCDLAE